MTSRRNRYCLCRLSDAARGTIQSPSGWVVGTGVPSPGQILVQWVSTDTPFDVEALGTLAGFSIASSAGPGVVAFSTLDDNFSQFDGPTSGPVTRAAVSTPEPGSLLLVGAAALAGLLARITAKKHWNNTVMTRQLCACMDTRASEFSTIENVKTTNTLDEMVSTVA